MLTDIGSIVSRQSVPRLDQQYFVRYATRYLDATMTRENYVRWMLKRPLVCLAVTTLALGEYQPIATPEESQSLIISRRSLLCHERPKSRLDHDAPIDETSPSFRPIERKICRVTRSFRGVVKRSRYESKGTNMVKEQQRDVEKKKERKKEKGERASMSLTYPALSADSCGLLLQNVIASGRSDRYLSREEGFVRYPLRHAEVKMRKNYAR